MRSERGEDIIKRREQSPLIQANARRKGEKFVHKKI